MAQEKDLQLLYPGGYFHVYNRGNNKETIFKSEENYFYFLSLWKKYIEPIAQTFCYNLLPNHFHFFIRIRENILLNDEMGKSKTGDNLRKSDELTPEIIRRRFSNFFNAYAKSINKRYGRTGSLFQERFRRKEIANIGYFTSLVGYIITNALKHGLVTRADEYPYSAYNAIVSEKPTLLLRNEIIAWFGGKKQFVDYINSYEADIVQRKLFLEFELDD
jgi:REP-associated tyrosine transposase